MNMATVHEIDLDMIRRRYGDSYKHAIEFICRTLNAEQGTPEHETLCMATLFTDLYEDVTGLWATDFEEIGAEKAKESKQ